jgi:hypothetical protein
VTGSFTKKQLRFTFTLAGDFVFEATGTNVLTLEGFRATAAVKAGGGTISTTAMLTIMGMAQSDMNALTFLAFDPRGLQRNEVRVEANSGDGWFTVFFGQIIEAMPDYSAMPDVFLRVEAVTGYIERVIPAAPLSRNGDVLITDVVKSIADAYGKNFEPNDVTGTVNNPYYPSTLGEQLRKFCEDVNVDLYQDVDVIAIQVRGKPRRLPVVNLTPTTGLIGYPTIDVFGIQVRCLYNSGIRFGGIVHVESDNRGTIDRLFPAQADGDWWVYYVEHYLQSETPQGAWESQLGLGNFAQQRVPNG